MVNPNPSFLSKRVKRRDPSGITSDRYEFLGLDQAEPDLGDPIVGPSSVGANPYTGEISDLYVLVADNSGTGHRYWTKQTNVISGGLVTPGSITVRNSGDIVGSVNQITDLNFVGSGVTVINPASWSGAGSSSVDISITVTDVSLPSGPTGSIAYKDASGFLQGSSDLIFDPNTSRVGINTILPKADLDVLGNTLISGIATIGVVTSRTGFFSDSLRVGNFEISDSTTFIKIVSGSVGIGTSVPIAILDVRGDVNISGIATISRVNTRNIIVSSASSFGSVSIGNTQVISPSRQLQNIVSLDSVTISTIEDIIKKAPNVFDDLIVIGMSTVPYIMGTNLNYTGISTIINLMSTNINNIGIATISNLVGTNLNYTGISTIEKANINNISVASSVGIGTTIANYDLDINGDINITGRISLPDSGFGVENQVLLSGGVGQSAKWGQPQGITVGSAASVGTLDVNINSIYYPAFVPKTEGVQSINLDSTGLVYNPSTNRLGIGTTSPSANLTVKGSTLLTGDNLLSGITTITNTLDINTTDVRYIPSTNRLGIGTTNPGSTLAVGGTITELYADQYWNVVTQADVGYGASQVPLNQYLGQLAFLDEYLPPQFRNTEVVTTSTSNVILDTLDGDFERSARYNIQITCNGQLIGSGTSSSSRSVTNLIQGKDYVSGEYNNIELTTISGTGNDARANISVIPEAVLTLNAIQNGEFAFQENVSGMTTNKPIIFNQAIPPTAAENSKVTSIITTNIGSGYTSIPNVTISNPTNNPAILGVSGIGSTATAIIDTMVVSNFVLTKAGVHTTIPTMQISAPIGVGTTASAIVGFGISTIFVSSSGSNYSNIPTITIPGNVVGGATSAFVSNAFLTNINVIRNGYGYTGTSGGPNYPIITIQSPTSGTTAIATVTTLGISTFFNINSPGIGYTRPPLMSVSAPGIGTTAIIGNTLGVVTFTDILPGSGYTISPSLSLSPTVSGFSAQVGMGISSSELQLFGGGGYESNPTVIFNPVGGIGTGAQASAQINIGGQVESITITNPGYGYTVPPLVSFSGGNPSVSAAATVTRLILTDINVNKIGFGVTVVPTVFLSPSGGLGNGASAIPSMGIGTVFVLNYGSGYTSAPSIAVTSIDGIIGSGGSVTSLGLGVTESNISIINSGIGYTFIPSITISTPTGIGTSSIASVGMGISQISVTNPGFGYSSIIPSVSFSSGGDNSISAGAAVSTIVTTNAFITNSGAGYTQSDLSSSGIVTFIPSGTQGVIGFGVSTFRITNLGIGYTTAQSAVITISNPNLGSGITATAVARLGFPGVLPGPGYGVTTQIYYISEIPSSTTLKLSTKPGIGTLTEIDVANVGFAVSNPKVFVGGNITNVSIVSPGSGYTSRSILSVNSSFDGGNVGTGFSFIASPVNNFQVSDVMLLSTVGSANTTAEFIEYSSLANEQILGSFAASITSGSNPQYTANLSFTPNYRNNTIKISRNKFGV